MIKYLKEDPWLVVEEGFHPEHQRSSESIFSIGNGKFGQRANFEEHYSGDSLRGSYVAGVYYPDKTRVGWWKNGYPEYFAKVLNSVNWMGVNVIIDGELLDLNSVQVSEFRRELDMRQGLLSRSFAARMSNGRAVKVHAVRFCNMDDDETAFVKYAVRVDGQTSANVVIESIIDGNVFNEDTNWDEQFWEAHSVAADQRIAMVQSVTRKTEFHVAAAAVSQLAFQGRSIEPKAYATSDNGFTAQQRWELELNPTEEVVLTKYVGLTSSLNYTPEGEEGVAAAAVRAAERAASAGEHALTAQHVAAWARIWEVGDIVIDGDVAAQQGIRFNIFHLNQTYTGKDDRLNIGPKGFTGEKYGGSTYWDTEAYCLPFYLNTHDPAVARQLLVYRYNQLDKAIENAEKLGFTNGAALYPMVTMNGEECHNEWEITFEEIHRNGAIAFGIYNYIRHTGDAHYLAEFGLDVLLGIARFWSQRVNWSEARQAYVMLGVTGPNEYENNVNNNWYTNYIARWCLAYTLEAIAWVKVNAPGAFDHKAAKWAFDEAAETPRWHDIIAKMALPQMEGSHVRLQQDGFLDKELLTVSDLRKEDRPINQKWSWDRILRSVFIKQADVLQGFYFFEDDFTLEETAANFDFYEPRTVHESSLSPCIHVVLAARLGRMEKAYELYLRTARLDLDDYNHEAYQGLHITSMAGTWLSVVEGFGGLRVHDGKLSLSPSLPAGWKGYSFRIQFRGRELSIRTTTSGTDVRLLAGDPLEVVLNGASTLVNR